jgi:peptide/nickel transport system permease protein
VRRTGVFRLKDYLFTVWVIVTLNFFLPRAMPGDPFLHISSEMGEEVAVFTEEQRQYYLEYYGLNRPIMNQYFSYLWEIGKGNLGFSLYYNEPVGKIIVKRLVWTGFLVITTVILSTLLGTALGSLSAWFRDRWVDKALFFNLILVSEVPAFLLGLILLFVFAAGTGWFPLSGAFTHFSNYNIFQRTLDILHHAVLPVVTLTITRLGGMYLLARNSMTSVLSRDYMRTAQAKGLSKPRIIFHHGMRNALLPIVTRVFLGLGGIVGGAILVENVFTYPGLGLLMREAVMMHDYALLQGIFLVVTLCVLLANLFADLIYRKLDPRIDDYAGLK